MILLDTCVLIWLASDPNQLTTKARSILQSDAEELFSSSISAFEVGLKVTKKRIALPLSTREWYELLLQTHGITELPLNAAIAAASTELPPIHNDPCDRFLIATAQLQNLSIMTSDTQIGLYPGIKIIW